MELKKVKEGDQPSAEQYNLLIDKVNALDKLTVSQPLGIATNANGGKQIWLRNPKEDFEAKIVNTGPLGTESDYTDQRYWVSRVYCSNDVSASDTEVTAAAFTEQPSDSGYRFITTATNIAEVATGGHGLAVGSIVKIEALYDAGTPATKRWIIPAAGGAVPRGQYVGQCYMNVSQNEMGMSQIFAVDAS